MEKIPIAVDTWRLAPGEFIRGDGGNQIGPSSEAIIIRVFAFPELNKLLVQSAQFKIQIDGNKPSDVENAVNRI